MFKEYQNQKNDSLGKDTRYYENRENVKFEEQKPILVDDFTKEEEEMLRQKPEACKRKRCAVAKKNKELKQIKKFEENEQKEKVLWEGLHKLNKEFLVIKNKKKNQTKMSDTTLK